jgi:hypothetical protein
MLCLESLLHPIVALTVDLAVRCSLRLQQAALRSTR